MKKFMKKQVKTKMKKTYQMKIRIIRRRRSIPRSERSNNPTTSLK